MRLLSWSVASWQTTSRVKSNGLRTRSREYSWVPLAQAGAPLAGRSGLDYFNALRNGELPSQPITATIGWSIAAVEEGRVRLSLIPDEYLLNAGGVMHGGVLSTLIDSATAGAAFTTVPAHGFCATTSLSVHFLSAVKADVGELFAEGVVIHRDARHATAEGRVEDSRGKIYARGTATLRLGRSRGV
jgi:uncharacterized protein (TIGR00369 family)